MLRVRRQQPLQASFLDAGENSVTARFHPTKHIQQIAFVLIAGVNIVEGKALKYLTFEEDPQQKTARGLERSPKQHAYAEVVESAVKDLLASKHSPKELQNLPIEIVQVHCFNRSASVCPQHKKFAPTRCDPLFLSKKVSLFFSFTLNVGGYCRQFNIGNSCLENSCWVPVRLHRSNWTCFQEVALLASVYESISALIQICIPDKAVIELKIYGY